MDGIVYPRLSFLLSIATIALLGNGLPAQAETVTLSRSQPAPTPGTTATRAAALAAPRLAKPASKTSTHNVAQADVNTGPTTSPGVETTPAPTTPEQTTPEQTTPAPTTPEQTTPAPTTPEQTTPAPTVSLTDVDPNYWAYPFIQALASRNAIAGFPDGTFRPDQPVSRAEFAAMIQKAFPQSSVRQLSPTGFSDVPADYWAASAIRAAYESGFMNGYPDNSFQPNQRISKVQAITALASGLNLTPSGPGTNDVSTYYTDAAQIPSYALDRVAAATQANLVVNYPDVRTLNPQTPLTRAEAAAHIYQALVRLGQVPPLSTNVAAANYIVGGPGAVSQAPSTTPAPTTPEATPPNETPTANVQPGRVTRGGSSYIGVGANFGVTGGSDLGDGTNFTVFSKIGLLNFLSVRPSVVIGGDPTVLVPLTFDFNFRPAGALGERFSIAPYAGAGIGIRTGNETDVGFLLTGGLDIPINRQFTATAGVNALFTGDTDVGVRVGIGYNFRGL